MPRTATDHSTNRSWSFSFRRRIIPPGASVECTHIAIPQAERTAAVLLSQPYWMWGAEMGANEYGVVIGNEAVWTTERMRKEGLLGMDLVRLGLERGRSAREALNVITGLLERHGQGGPCTVDGRMEYHNSFIIADRDEAYVLETADKFWVAERMKEGVRNISNSLSVTSWGDLRSEGIDDIAVERTSAGIDPPHFAAAFSPGGRSAPSPYSREGRCGRMLAEEEGRITPDTMASILREHEAGVCMHGPFLTAGAQISVLTGEGALHFFTGTAPTCLSVFHPYAFSEECLGLETPGPHGSVDGGWLWMRHRQASFNLQKDPPRLRKLTDKLRERERRVFSELSSTALDPSEIIKANRSSHSFFEETLGL